MFDGYMPPIFVLLGTGVLLFVRKFFSAERRMIFDMFITASIIIFAAFLMFMMGRVWMCECGYIKLWQGVVASAENSQHISDWYTFSHVIHGFLFFGFLWLVARKLSLSLRLVIATALEAAWEVLENTPMVINRYREVTISWGYFGDSILNSTLDILAMIFGFWLARRLPLWVTIVLTLLMEIGVAYVIRDNLLLNVIMLVYPLEAIRVWQAGG